MSNRAHGLTEMTLIRTRIFLNFANKLNTYLMIQFKCVAILYFTFYIMNIRAVYKIRSGSTASAANGEHKPRTEVE